MAVGFSFTDVLLLPALIGYTIWWAFDLRKGARVRRSTLALHLVVYGLAAFYVWAVSLGEIVLAGGSSSDLTWVWTMLLSAVAVVAAEVGIWYGEHRMVVERRAEGGWHYRGPILIALFWFGLYAIRFGLEDGVLGGYSVFLPPGPGPPAGVSLDAFIDTVLVVASLYLVSFGFLLGITGSIWRHHQRSLTDGSLGEPRASPEGSPSHGGANRSAARRGTATSGSPTMGSSQRIASDRRGPSSAGDPPSSLLEVAAPGATLTCPRCGSPWPSSVAYCGECGAPLPRPDRT